MSVILHNYPVVAGFVAGLISSGGDLTAGIIGRLTGAALHFLGGVTFGIKGSLEDILGTSLAHRVVGGTSSLASGGSFLSGFLSSGTTQAFSPLIGDFQFEPIRVAIAAGIGGTASVLGGGTFENGAMTGAFAYLISYAAKRPLKPPFQYGKGGTAFVGGFSDLPSHGPVISAYYAHVAKAYAGAYFQWYQSEALAQWIVANGDNVNVIAHSYGADMAAEDVAAGHPVNELRTVDHVGWTRPNFADVAANAGIWLDYIAIGGGATWPHFLASIGGKWTNAPSEYATSIPVIYDHADACYQYCSP